MKVDVRLDEEPQGIFRWEGPLPRVGEVVLVPAWNRDCEVSGVEYSISMPGDEGSMVVDQVTMFLKRR